MDSHDVVSEHRAAGRRLEAAGISSFVREAGPPGGEPVVCLHGVPASCFLYRKVLRELAARGLRGIAFDLPGLGLADRRATFDYTWTGLGRFCAAAVDALGLDRFHLVVHDIGGPAGFELCAALTNLTGRPATAHTEPEISARSPRQTTRRPSAPIRRYGIPRASVPITLSDCGWSSPARA